MKEKLVPTLFATNFKDLKARYHHVSSLSPYLHLDIMDGKFTNQKTKDLNNIITFLSKQKKKFFVHLMCNKPSRYFDLCSQLGAEKVYIHLEAYRSIQALKKDIDNLKQRGISCVLTINPSTSFDVLIPYLYCVEEIMFMGVTPGKEGQEFCTTTFDKVSRLHDFDKSLIIHVDGGIKSPEIRRLIRRHAHIINLGSILGNSPYPKKEYNSLKKVFAKALKEKKSILEEAQEYSKITPYLMLGSNICCQKVFFDTFLTKLNISVEISLEEFPKTPPLGIEYYLWVPIQDHQAPSIHTLHALVQNIHLLIEAKKRIYIHCELGHTRSPTIVIAYLMYSRAYGFQKAFNFVKKKRPSIDVTVNQRAALTQYEKFLLK